MMPTRCWSASVICTESLRRAAPVALMSEPTWLVEPLLFCAEPPFSAAPATTLLALPRAHEESPAHIKRRNIHACLAIMVAPHARARAGARSDESQKVCAAHSTPPQFLFFPRLCIATNPLLPFCRHHSC